MALTLLTLILILLVVCIAAMIVALYVFPIEIAGTVGYHKEPQADMRTSWGPFAVDVVPGEIIEIRVLLFGRRIYRRLITKEEREKVKKEQEIEEKKKELIEERKPVPPAEMLRRFVRAWPDLKKPAFTALRSLRVAYITSDTRLGFGNPVVTGEVYGWYWVVKGILSPLNTVRLHMEPVFNERVIEGDASLCIAVQRPLMIMLAGMWAFTKKPVRDLFRQGAAQ